jgi:prepilin-type N-terminal cleavage/methylation domain-containing protein
MEDNSGFTLIELLVVISIIAVLATFIFPNLIGAKEKAKEAAIASIVHNFQNGIESYYLDNSNYPDGSNLSALGLYNLLSPGGYMKSIPRNPYTGLGYSEEDNSGRIVYSSDNDAGTYSIIGYKRDGATEVISLTNF